MKFRLTKLQVIEGETSRVAEGYHTTGVALLLFNWETKEERNINAIADLQTGFQLMLLGGGQYIRTSTIREISWTSPSKDTVTFRTETSWYMLEELKGE